MLTRRPVHQTRAKIRLIEFLRPDAYWPSPYSIEQAFELLRLMLASGVQYSDPGRWGRSGVAELLHGHNVVNCSSIGPITGTQDLRCRFHRALLGKGNPAVERWRSTERFTLDTERWFHFPHYPPFGGTPFQGEITSESVIFQTLDRYFRDSHRKKLAVSLNSVHPSVTTIIDTQVLVLPDTPGFVFLLRYGSSDGSLWHHYLAATGPHESFLDTFDRAFTRLRLLQGDLIQDPAALADRLNTEDLPRRGATPDTPDWAFWTLSHGRVVQVTLRPATRHYAIAGAIGLAARPDTGISLVHLPSRRILLRTRAFDYDALTAVARELETDTPDAARATALYHHHQHSSA